MECKLTSTTPNVEDAILPLDVQQSQAFGQATWKLDPVRLSKLSVPVAVEEVVFPAIEPAELIEMHNVHCNLEGRWTEVGAGNAVFDKFGVFTEGTGRESLVR